MAKSKKQKEDYNEYEEQEMLLYDHIRIEATIECSKCSETETIDEDDINYFMDNGWKVINGECLCPECNKKLNKKKK